MSAGLFVQVSEDLLRSGLPVMFPARGFSMIPTIRDAEEIVVAPVAAAEVRRGDIVLYRAPGGVIAHRVVKIRRSVPRLTFVFRGDAMDDCDEPVMAEQVLGRVLAVVRDGRRRSLTGVGPLTGQMVRIWLWRHRRRFLAASRVS